MERKASSENGVPVLGRESEWRGAQPRGAQAEQVGLGKGDVRQMVCRTGPAAALLSVKSGRFPETREGGRQ